MINIQIILAWLAIIVIVFLGAALFFKLCEKIEENLPPLDFFRGWNYGSPDAYNRDEGNSGCLGNILYGILATTVFSLIAFTIVEIYNKFIDNQWSQKPKPAIVEQQTKPTNQQALSQEEQMIKDTLQEN